MIHFWKGLDLEITDFNYHHDPTPSGETIPSQTSNLQTCREYKSFRKKLHMIHRWNGLDLDITDFKYHHDPTQLGEATPSQTSNT